MTTVLVTGTGAIIGYGVLRALRARPEIRTVAADIYDHAVGQHFADEFVQAPLTSDPGYNEWLDNTVRHFGVDLIVPCIEQDVSWLAGSVLAGKPPTARLCLNNPKAILLCADKGDFDSFLATTDSDFRIPTRYSGTFDDLARELGVPFLLKPRRGYASKGIVKIYSESDLRPYASRLGHHFIAQRLVGTDDQEFTVSAFCDHGSVCAMIALRRYLAADGSTVRANCVPFEPFETAISALAEKLQLDGPSNFQFRLADGQYYLLEINPRISSSASIRTAFGFNEAAMAVDYFLHGKPVTQPSLGSGSAIRYIEDIIIHERRSDL